MSLGASHLYKFRWGHPKHIGSQMALFVRTTGNLNFFLGLAKLLETSTNTYFFTGMI
ncbi:hypothetical protein NC653_016001 [Populus alba x Populus x berolinensis]|uniref:Uncharacterized protein n=1 Tax=Populus alba x Populus x berolinensis TaxID=444605 RepID=A0AAD6QLQ7_9ROSI|nr:hypothetical protein NC653_016001 [Populus alba x Populus x berolinensis]